MRLHEYALPSAVHTLTQRQSAFFAKHRRLDPLEFQVCFQVRDAQSHYSALEFLETKLSRTRWGRLCWAIIRPQVQAWKIDLFARFHIFETPNEHLTPAQVSVKMKESSHGH